MCDSSPRLRSNVGVKFRFVTSHFLFPVLKLFSQTDENLDSHHVVFLKMYSTLLGTLSVLQMRTCRYGT